MWLPTDGLCVLPAPKLRLGYPEIMQAELKSWKGCGWGEKAARRGCAGNGVAGREASESKRACRGSALHSTGNTLDPKPLMPGVYLPVCLPVHEYWLSAAL